MWCIALGDVFMYQVDNYKGDTYLTAPGALFKITAYIHIHTVIDMT